MLAISNVIQNLRQAKIYAQVVEREKPTVSEIAAAVDSSTTTVYEDVEQLVAVGLLERVTETQPYRFQPQSIEIAVQTDSEYLITPLLLVARARADSNENIRLYVDRHGISGLATAIEYARSYVQDETNARLMARDLDIPVLEAETILQELREVIQEVEPESVAAIDLDELDAAVDADHPE
jgi:sugar-specific transcriptional regulator TrmB